MNKKHRQKISNLFYLFLLVNFFFIFLNPSISLLDTYLSIVIDINANLRKDITFRSGGYGFDNVTFIFDGSPYT